MSAIALRPALFVLAGIQLFEGLALALAPGRFYDAVADFGPRNDHDLRDMAAFYLAAAMALAVAARRPAWRVPVLALCVMQYALHALNHLLDLGDADPGWVGPVDVVSIGALGIVLAVALRAAAQDGGA